MTDPIADMIIRLKNASMVGKDVVSFPASKLKLAIAERLKTRGFLTEVRVRGSVPHKTIEVTLGKNKDGSFRISEVKRISKPGARVYANADSIRVVRGGLGVSLVSTPNGILYGDEARKAHVGGEVLFEVW
jgi:small subunit ribosomal protein S8